MTDEAKALVAHFRAIAEWLDPEIDMIEEQDVLQAADRIEALEAENERLREALGLADAALSGANMNMNVVERKVRAALGEKQ